MISSELKINYTDEQIASLVLRGKKELFGDLIRKYTPKLGRYAFRFGIKYEDQEDSLQETFLKAYKSLDSFNAELGTFSQWIYRIAHNEFVNLLTNKKNNPSLEEILSFGKDFRSEVAADQEIRNEGSQLSIAVNSLNSIDRKLLHMRYFQYLSVKEIGQDLSIDSSNVTMRLHRARKKLKEILTK